MRIGLLSAGLEIGFAKRSDLYEVVSVDEGVDYLFATRDAFITEAMLDAFPNRIIILDDGDVTEQLLAGATATRTSLYFGDGPLFLVGPRYFVPKMVQDALARRDYDSVATYALLHSRWMRRAWPDLMLRAIECLAAGTVKIVRDTVWVDGVPGPCRLGEAPDFCDERVQRGIPASCPFIQL
jgi:hypothetical protein